jgi:hypothetical protein
LKFEGVSAAVVASGEAAAAGVAVASGGFQPQLRGIFKN